MTRDSVLNASLTKLCKNSPTLTNTGRKKSKLQKPQLEEHLSFFISGMAAVVYTLACL